MFVIGGSRGLFLAYFWYCMHNIVIRYKNSFNPSMLKPFIKFIHFTNW